MQTQETKFKKTNIKLTISMMALATADNVENTNDVVFNTNCHRLATQKETINHTSN